MQLNKEEVKKIAKLARVELTDEEIDFYNKELATILNWVEQLQKVDTDNVKPLHSPQGCPLPKRKDEVTDGGITEEVLNNAPSAKFNCFSVPKVVE